MRTFCWLGSLLCILARCLGTAALCTLTQVLQDKQVVDALCEAVETMIEPLYR